MSFSFQVLTQEQAEEIAYRWQYEEPYAFYNMDSDEEDLHDFLDPQKRGSTVYAVMQGRDLYAFFSIERVGQEMYEIGLGMKPEHTGRGGGKAFIRAIVDYVVSSYSPAKLTLSVATFNQRAIHVYRQNGFFVRNVFMQRTNGDVYEFLRMERWFTDKAEK